MLSAGSSRLVARGTVVVKIGGSTLGAHDTSLEDLVRLQSEGRRVVAVHGGGPAISDWLTRQNTPTRFVRGLRVTDAAALDIVVAVLAGVVNTQLVAGLNARGGRACGLSGADGCILRAVYEDEELGFVGRIERVDTALLAALLDAGFMPVVAPIAVLAEGGGPAAGQLLNVNADTVAGEIARALGAERLVFLTDVAGVRGVDGGVMGRLDQPGVTSLMEAGVIAGGMIPKVEAGLLASRAGTSCVILDGREPGSLVAALDEDPPGTLVAVGRVDAGRAQ